MASKQPKTTLFFCKYEVECTAMNNNNIVLCLAPNSQVLRDLQSINAFQRRYTVFLCALEITHLSGRSFVYFAFNIWLTKIRTS